MWSEGIIVSPATGEKYRYWTKHYEEGSQFGVDGGRISKLTIRKPDSSSNLVNYDRGWDIQVPDSGEVESIYNIILEKYN